MDRFLATADAALRTLFATPSASTASPASGMPDVALEPGALMRAAARVMMATAYRI